MGTPDRATTGGRQPDNAVTRSFLGSPGREMADRQRLPGSRDSNATLRQACARSGSGHRDMSKRRCSDCSPRPIGDRRRSWRVGSCGSRSASRHCSCSSPSRVLVLLPSSRELSVPTAIALTLLYAVASRVEFESGVASTVPTQLVFVPMLFLLPIAAVPLFVAAGLLLGRLPRYLSGYTPANRAVVELGDALYSIGPVLVLGLAGADTPAFGDWPLYVLALRPSSPATSRSRASACGSGWARRRGWRCASSAGSASPTRCCRASGCSSASPPRSRPTRSCSSCRCSPC